jgi:hypothetical protein
VPFVPGGAAGAAAITVLPSPFDATIRLSCAVEGNDSRHCPPHFSIKIIDKDHPALMDAWYMTILNYT